MGDESLALAQTIGAELAYTETLAAPSGGAEPSAPAPALAPRERFTLEREIGRGGMGRVLEATDRQFRRKVAIKEMLPVGGAAAKKRFLTEALVTGNLQHPGIPAVYERGDRDGGGAYYAMQLVSGRTLAEALDEARSLDERLHLLPAVIKVAETVAYAHDRGVVHRDLKPENVLIGRHGEVFLLDWGIAKVRGLATTGLNAGENGDASKTQVGVVMGSPMYMAPEQARGETDAIDERTDVFALGAMLYHVLTGRAPYQGTTVRELATKAAEARPPSVPLLVSEVSPELAAICAKAMEREAPARYASALDLAAALEGFQSASARKAPSKLLSGVLQVSLGAVGLMGVLLLALGLFGIYELSKVGAVIVWASLFATIVSFALAIVEHRTRGDMRLLGVGLALVPVTLAVAASQMLLGAIHTFAAVAALLARRNVLYEAKRAER